MLVLGIEADRVAVAHLEFSDGRARDLRAFVADELGMFWFGVGIV